MFSGNKLAYLRTRREQWHSNGKKASRKVEKAMHERKKKER
jgi:hypothetical protein